MKGKAPPKAMPRVPATKQDLSNGPLANSLYEFANSINHGLLSAHDRLTKLEERLYPEADTVCDKECVEADSDSSGLLRDMKTFQEGQLKSIDLLNARITVLTARIFGE